MECLRLQFKAPTAHYRVPFTYKVRQSYPIPPYSTVIGLLCNVLGIGETIDAFLSQPFGLYIAGRFQSLTHEYTWLRNMKQEEHIKRFKDRSRREIDQVPEHPGGQVPVTLDVLNEVETVVYLIHPCREILMQIHDNLFYPEVWLSHLHLGRSEDWVVPENISVVTPLPSLEVEPIWTKDRGYYYWLPYPEDTWELDKWGNRKEYEELFRKAMGTPQLVTALYRKVEEPKGNGEFWKIRNFNHIRAKICSGQVPLVEFGSLPKVLVDPDPELMLPIFPACILWR
ncbi:MAG: type I-B CRISPR-associated protein Cas5 [Firmicutes bacterium]|nr:type I-B CRISPR-associated protein Cas5 [Bacillota bacterium]